jgi:hypothetical protein
MPYKCDGINCQARHDLVKSFGCKVPIHTSPECWYVGLGSKEYEARIKLLQHDLLIDIEAVAEQARAEVIRPFCDRHQLRFDSSMGAYAFFDKDGTEQSSNWERGLDRPGQPPWEFAPADYLAVHRVLNTEVDRSSLLFEYMEAYDATNTP